MSRIMLIRGAGCLLLDRRCTLFIKNEYDTNLIYFKAKYARYRDMKKKLVLIITVLLSCYSMAEEYKGDTGLLSNQLADWCVGGGQYQNFCHGYLMGVYETTSCLVTRKSPDWNELKKVYLGWFYSNGNNVSSFRISNGKSSF